MSIQLVKLRNLLFLFLVVYFFYNIYSTRFCCNANVSSCSQSHGCLSLCHVMLSAILTNSNTVLSSHSLFLSFFYYLLNYFPFLGFLETNTVGFVFVLFSLEQRQSFSHHNHRHFPKMQSTEKNVESLYQHRLKLCETNTDVFKVESELGLGNIEEVIAMGYDELNLIPVYVEGKMHEN